MLSTLGPLGEGALSRLFRDRGCQTLEEASAYLAALPYGRPDGQGPEQVLLEGRGTCSSKHALFVLTCREAGQPAKLVIGFFEMDDENVPGVGDVLRKAGLKGVWEAHCFAQLPDGPIDVTGLPSGLGSIDLQDLVEIEPADIGKKAELHRNALAAWAEREGIGLALDDLWNVRERCIAAL